MTRRLVIHVDSFVSIVSPSHMCNSYFGLILFYLFFFPSNRTIYKHDFPLFFTYCHALVGIFPTTRRINETWLYCCIPGCIFLSGSFQLWLFVIREVAHIKLLQLHGTESRNTKRVAVASAIAESLVNTQATSILHWFVHIRPRMAHLRPWDRGNPRFFPPVKFS